MLVQDISKVWSLRERAWLVSFVGSNVSPGLSDFNKDGACVPRGPSPFSTGATVGLGVGTEETMGATVGLGRAIGEAVGAVVGCGDGGSSSNGRC